MPNDFLDAGVPSARDEAIALNEEMQEIIWRKDRLGRATGSRIFDIIALTKAGKPTAERGKYLDQLSNERMTGVPREERFVSQAMLWGMEQEKNAISIYALESPETVLPFGRIFVPHPRILYAGCSPDALVGDHGGLEVKCPETGTHKRFLRSGIIPDEYLPQVLWCMICTECEWWDFMSYDPRCPEHMRKRVIRVERKNHLDMIRKLEDAVASFLEEVEKDVQYWKDWRP